MTEDQLVALMAAIIYAGSQANSSQAYSIDFSPTVCVKTARSILDSVEVD